VSDREFIADMVRSIPGFLGMVGLVAGAALLVLVLAACVHLHVDRSVVSDTRDDAPSLEAPDVAPAAYIRPTLERAALAARLNRIRGEVDGMCRAEELAPAACEDYRRRLLDLALAVTEDEFAAVGVGLAAQASTAESPTLRAALLDLAGWIRGRLARR
jgi:hypothetical protein